MVIYEKVHKLWHENDNVYTIIKQLVDLKLPMRTMHFGNSKPCGKKAINCIVVGQPLRKAI